MKRVCTFLAASVTAVLLGAGEGKTAEAPPRAQLQAALERIREAAAAGQPMVEVQLFGGSCTGTPAGETWDFRCEAVPAASLRPWLPRAIVMDGTVSARFMLRLLPGNRFEADGKGMLAGGTIRIPFAGIRIPDVEVEGAVSEDHIDIKAFRAASGPGRIEGSGALRLEDGRVTEYRGTLRGENFRALRRSNIRAVVSPRIELSGSRDKITVSGELLLPEVRVSGDKEEGGIRPSPDAVVIDAPPPEAAPPFEVVLKLGVTLGDHVTVKAKGVDARLAGRLDLSGDTRSLTSKGELTVAEGDFSAYGIGLKIVRGRILYAGGPLADPTVDIVALRTVGEVKAGVNVGGTVQAPVVKLYSEPAMPDVDILAYIVLGHPLGEDREQASLLSRAAGVLLSAGQSVALRDQLRTRLGLSTLELQTTAEKGTGHMGYKPLTSTPAAAASAAATGTAGAISESVLTVGKYLTPKLYVSYGRSIFSDVNIFRLRYDLSPRWQVETQAGAESGADLYYKWEFD